MCVCMYNVCVLTWMVYLTVPGVFEILQAVWLLDTMDRRAPAGLLIITLNKNTERTY